MVFLLRKILSWFSEGRSPLGRRRIHSHRFTREFPRKSPNPTHKFCYRAVFAFTLYRERPSDIIDSETDQSRAASEVMKGGDTFATLLSVTQAVPECFPYEWGGTLVAPLVAPVPRAWWAGKPSAYGNVLARRFWGNDVKTSVAPSLPGEFYANFGLWGVFPSMLVVGWVLRSLQGWYRCWEHLPAAKAIQVMFLPNVVGLIRGDFFNAIAPVIFIYLPLSVLFVSRRPRK